MIEFIGHNHSHSTRVGDRSCAFAILHTAASSNEAHYIQGALVHEIRSQNAKRKAKFLNEVRVALTDTWLKDPVIDIRHAQTVIAFSDVSHKFLSGVFRAAHYKKNLVYIKLPNTSFVKNEDTEWDNFSKDKYVEVLWVEHYVHSHLMAIVTDLRR